MGVYFFFESTQGSTIWWFSVAILDQCFCGSTGKFVVKMTQVILSIYKVIYVSCFVPLSLLFNPSLLNVDM